MEQAERRAAQAEQAEADRQALLAESRREAQQIRNRADDHAKRMMADAEARADERANRSSSKPRPISSARSRSGCMAQVRAQIGDLVATGVDRVTRGAVDAKRNADAGAAVPE